MVIIGFFAEALTAGVYAYAHDLLEGTDKNKWKKINPYERVKPQKWHTEVQLLLYIRYVNQTLINDYCR